jgi:hypothetical protein
MPNLVITEGQTFWLWLFPESFVVPRHQLDRLLILISLIGYYIDYYKAGGVNKSLLKTYYTNTWAC